MPDTVLTPNFSISANAAKRVAALAAAEGKPGLMMRVAVSGGGCSGFKYEFNLDSTVNPEDRVFEKDGVKVVVDETSLEFLGNAELDFKEDLMGSYFAVTNPNAKSSCGCGASFAVD